MVLYTFYPCRLDDVSLGFEAHEVADDAAALARTLQVLRDHDSARFVVVWCGDRKVGIRFRAPGGVELACGRPAEAAARLTSRSGRPGP